MKEVHSIGPYSLHRELGRGGTAIVYEATDERNGKTVALKALTPTAARVGGAGGAPEAADVRLQREAEAVARLKHPNIVNILDVGAAPDSLTPDAAPVHYLVMELVNGETLRDHLRREGTLPFPVAARIIDQVASGLDAIHAAGVVHRDIKPSNILLLPDGTAKITDFGIAHQLEDTVLKRNGHVVGSPKYMSPEQVIGEPVSVASDLWSLAVVLYEMLLGKVPYAGETATDTLYQIAHGGDRPPFPATLPTPVRDVLTRALARNQALRFQDANSLAEAFREALQPPETRAAHMPRRRRPRYVVPIAVAAATATVAVLLFSFSAVLDRRKPEPLSKREREHVGKTASVAEVEKKKETKPRKEMALPAERLAEEPSALPTPQQANPANPADTVEQQRQRPASALPTAVRAPSRALTPLSATSLSSPGAITVDARTSGLGGGSRELKPYAVAAPPLPAVEAPPAAEGQNPASAAQAPPAPSAPAPSSTPPAESTPAPSPASSASPSSSLSSAPSNKQEKAEGTPAVDPLTQLPGIWHGRYSGQPASLVVSKPDLETGKFTGTLNVQTANGPVNVAVTGQAFDDGGITLHETNVLSEIATAPWRLGVDAGTFDEDAMVLSGRGHAAEGQEYTWSFRR